MPVSATAVCEKAKSRKLADNKNRIRIAPVVARALAENKFAMPASRHVHQCPPGNIMLVNYESVKTA